MGRDRSAVRAADAEKRGWFVEGGGGARGYTPFKTEIGAEEAGLEMLDRDGRWLAIKPPKGAMVVNVGDMLQRLTNHVLPSTTHRVPTPRRNDAADHAIDALLPPPRAGFPD